NARALARVSLGNAFANSRAGAGHMRDLAIEAHEATPFARGKEGLAATTGGKAATVRPRQGPADINLALSAEQTSGFALLTDRPQFCPLIEWALLWLTIAQRVGSLGSTAPDK